MTPKVPAGTDTTRRARPIRRWASLAMASAFVFVACGGGDSAAACDALVAVDQAFTVNEDPEAGIAALEDFVAAAPDDVATEVESIIPLFRQDPAAAIESEEVAAAETAFDEYALDNCGDARVDVGAFDYTYAGPPSELEVGRIVFDLTNQTQAGEFHEALLLRQEDGFAETPHDQLSGALGAPISVEATLEALGQFTLVDVGFVEPEGGDTQDVFVADLEPGEYILVCLLPVNSPDSLEAYFAGEQIDGPRHFDQGMYAEFTVS